MDFEDFDKDREEVINRAREGGVEKIINIGCNLERAKKSIEIAKNHDFICAVNERNENKFSFPSEQANTGLKPFIFASAGLHPQEADLGDEKFFSELKKLLKEPKVVAIGECGLEYFGEHNNPKSREKQKEVFLRHLELARKFKKPVIIHCRNAYSEILEILKTEKENNPKLSGVVHFFSGRLSQAEEFLKLDFLLSFTGVITFARDYDRVIKVVPLEKIMVETDAPFACPQSPEAIATGGRVAPVPYRGQRNEPLYVKYVAQKIAELKGLDFEKVAQITTNNAQNLFGI